MIEEHELSGPVLAETIASLIADPARIAAMEDASRRLGRPDAAARVADLLVGPEVARV